MALTILNLHLFGALTLGCSIVALLYTWLFRPRSVQRDVWYVKIIAANAAAQFVTGSLLAIVSSGMSLFRFCSNIAIYLAIVVVVEVGLFWRLRKFAHTFPKSVIRTAALISAGFVVIALAVPARAEVYSKNLVSNGEFEQDLTDWAVTNVDSNNIDTQFARSGNYVTLGMYGETELILQELELPTDAGKITLSFFTRFYTNDTTKNDYSVYGLRNPTTNEYYVLYAQYPSDGEITDWAEIAIDISEFAGKTVQLIFSTTNDADNLTFADFDGVAVVAQSYAELRGTVKLQTTKLRNAEVTIRNAKGKKMWTGTTNKKGKFTATGLAGSSKKYSVTVKKDHTSKKFKVKLSWAKATKKTFQL